MTVQLMAIAISLALAAPGWALVAGGGSKRSDCFFEADFGSLSTPTKGQTTRIQCTDCDQNCDAGPAEADGACVLSFDICPKQTDSALPNCDATRTLGAAKLKGLTGSVNTASTECQPVTASVKMKRRRGNFRKTAKTFRARVKATGRPRLTDTDNYRITCNPSPGSCITTTTTTSTTTTTEPPLVSVPCPDAASGPLAVSSFDFTTSVLPSPLDDCGKVTDDVSGGGTTLKLLKCGGLSIGGGASTVLQGPTPDGATTRFCISSCDADTCTLTAGTDFSATHDCSSRRCFFGPPLPIPNGGQTTCVVNTLSADASGTINYNTGETVDMVIPLNSQTYLTANATQPCPICRSGGTACAGTPESPCTGTCDRGANTDGACTSTNSDGLSKDCPPGGVAPGAPCVAGDPAQYTCADNSLNLGGIPVNLDPLSTGRTTSANQDGLHCPGQDGSIDPALTYPGCFGTSVGISDGLTAGLCRYIEENGTPSGSLLPIGTAKDSVTGSVFCIPKTSSALINFAAALPGPGSITLPGKAKLNASVTETTTTTTDTTTTTTTTTSTTTTTT